jgi:hypothetical protein
MVAKKPFTPEAIQEEITGQRVVGGVPIPVKTAERFEGRRVTPVPVRRGGGTFARPEPRPAEPKPITEVEVKPLEKEVPVRPTPKQVERGARIAGGAQRREARLQAMTGERRRGLATEEQIQREFEAKERREAAKPSAQKAIAQAQEAAFRSVSEAVPAPPSQLQLRREREFLAREGAKRQVRAPFTKFREADITPEEAVRTRKQVAGTLGGIPSGIIGIAATPFVVKQVVEKPVETVGGALETAATRPGRFVGETIGGIVALKGIGSIPKGVSLVKSRLARPKVKFIIKKRPKPQEPKTEVQKETRGVLRRPEIDPKRKSEIISLEEVKRTEIGEFVLERGKVTSEIAPEGRLPPQKIKTLTGKAKIIRIPRGLKVERQRQRFVSLAKETDEGVQVETITATIEKQRKGLGAGVQPKRSIEFKTTQVKQTKEGFDIESSAAKATSKLNRIVNLKQFKRPPKKRVKTPTRDIDVVLSESKAVDINELKTLGAGEQQTTRIIPKTKRFKEEGFITARETQLLLRRGPTEFERAAVKTQVGKIKRTKPQPQIDKFLGVSLKARKVARRAERLRLKELRRQASGKPAELTFDRPNVRRALAQARPRPVIKQKPSRVSGVPVTRRGAQVSTEIRDIPGAPPIKSLAEFRKQTPFERISQRQFRGTKEVQSSAEALSPIAISRRRQRKLKRATVAQRISTEQRQRPEQKIDIIQEQTLIQKLKLGSLTRQKVQTKQKQKIATPTITTTTSARARRAFRTQAGRGRKVIVPKIDDKKKVKKKKRRPATFRQRVITKELATPAEALRIFT